MLVTPIPAFSDNYIWAIVTGDKVIVVDPGDAVPVDQFLQQHGYTLTAILITHHHADHTGGIEPLLQNHNNLKIFAPANESVQGTTETLSGGEKITPNDSETTFEVFSVPGHTKGHLAYYVAPYLFCGDTLFSGGCGRLFEGTAEQMYHSLQSLNRLPENTLVFPAHEYTLSNLAFAQAVEPDNSAITTQIKKVKQLRSEGKPSLPTLLSDERRFNPFLRTSNSRLQTNLQRQFASIVDDPLAAFTLLRRWKDNF